MAWKRSKIYDLKHRRLKRGSWALGYSNKIVIWSYLVLLAREPSNLPDPWPNRTWRILRSLVAPFALKLRFPFWGEGSFGIFNAAVPGGSQAQKNKSISRSGRGSQDHAVRALMHPSGRGRVPELLPMAQVPAQIGGTPFRAA